MKTFIGILSLALLASSACGQAQKLTRPSQWKATVRVIDESGQPVGRAAVTIGYYTKAHENTPEAISTDAKRGLTDTNGYFVASGSSSSIDLTFAAEKTGFYKTRLSYELGAPHEYEPKKWSPNATLVLKAIRNPIPMYAKWVNTSVPALDVPVGFDFMVGDWVGPFGKGAHVDLFFTAQLDDKGSTQLVVTFPNNGDGIQEAPSNEYKANEGSALRSSHEAPTAGYQPQWVKTERHPSHTGLNQDLNFFVRVRTELDERGEIKSAHYGKIYGEFMNFRYYLNPTPNDLNIEFDPKRNLIRSLRGSQIVDAP